MRSGAPGRLVAGALVALCAALAGVNGQAADFRSVAERAAVLYDAPSTRAQKLFVVSQFYPVEIIVNVDNWVKVRDASGEMAWMEKRVLAERRTVLIRTAVADVRLAAGDNSPLVFQARQGVVLDLAEWGPDGWIKVRHRDGQTGYIRNSQVWGL